MIKPMANELVPALLGGDATLGNVCRIWEHLYSFRQGKYLLLQDFVDGQTKF